MTMKQFIEPFYSVIIPVFNRADVILPTLESVIGQSFSDFECIIVDDGSNDSEQLQQVIKKISDRRFKYIKQENGGGGSARNLGMKTAIGKFIAFLDSDDIFLAHHLKNSQSTLLENPKNCVYTQVEVNRGDNVNFIKPHRALLPEEHISDYLMKDRGFVQTSTLIIPIKLVELIEYDEKISFGQDVDFAIKIYNADYKLIMLPTPGAIWNDVWTSNRLSSHLKPEQRLTWLNSIRPFITRKAYWADKGWPVAKGYASQGHKFRALALYFNALIRGCYHPKVALVVFLQVMFSKQAYRKFSDLLVKFGVKP